MKSTFCTPAMPDGILLNMGWLPAMPVLQPSPAGLPLAEDAGSTRKVPKVVVLSARSLAVSAVIQLEMSHVPENVNLKKWREHHGLA